MDAAEIERRYREWTEVREMADRVARQLLPTASEAAGLCQTPASDLTFWWVEEEAGELVFTYETRFRGVLDGYVSYPLRAFADPLAYEAELNEQIADKERKAAAAKEAFDQAAAIERHNQYLALKAEFEGTDA